MKKFYGKGYRLKATWKDNQRLYKIWHGMLSRCYNDNHIRKASYQDRGVYVSDEWLCFDNFVADAEKLDGWDKELFDNKLLELDKDLKGGSYYSKETCQWVSKEMNNSFQPSSMKQFIAITPNGNSLTYNSQNKCARDNNLDLSCINGCLKGSRKSHKRWTFHYI